MPYKIPSHNTDRNKRIAKIGAVVPAHLARARKFRSSGNWQAVVKIHKLDNPLCFDPFHDHEKDGRSVFVDQVHHIWGLATHWHLRSYAKNLASLCTGCHSKIEQMERKGHPTQHLFKSRPEC